MNTEKLKQELIEEVKDTKIEDILQDSLHAMENAKSLLENIQRTIDETFVVGVSQAKEYLNKIPVTEILELTQELGMIKDNLNLEMLATRIRQDELNAEFRKHIDSIKEIYEKYEEEDEE